MWQPYNSTDFVKIAKTRKEVNSNTKASNAVTKKNNWIPTVSIILALLMFVTSLLLFFNLRKTLLEQKEKQQRMEQTITIQDNNLRSIQDSLLIESDDGKYDGITVKIEELIEQIKNQGILIDNQQQIIANLQTTVDELKEQNAENGDEYILYTVRSGDSLGKICSSLGVDYWKNRDLILNLNNIKDENIIIVGQVLFFPKSIQNQ